MESLKGRIDHLRSTVAKLYPDNPEYLDEIPSSDKIDIQRMQGSAGTVADTCPGARLAAQCLANRIGDKSLYHQDCHDHMRNILWKNMEIALTKRLKIILADSLDEISPELRVSTSFHAAVRSYDKGFSLSANYPKGFGSIFGPWMKEYQPGEILFHIEGAQGSRFDLSLLAAPAFYMNRRPCLRFLAEQLRLPKRRDNILMRNLYCLMRCPEIVALSRLMSILHLAYLIPMRFLAAKCPELKEYDFGPASMGLVLDKMRDSLLEIKSNPGKFIDENFMMSIFDHFSNTVEPLKDHCNFIFEKRRLRMVGKKNGAGVLTFAELRSECFHPKNVTNRNTEDRVKELAVVAADAILAEMNDKNKAIWQYISAHNGPKSWDILSDETKQLLMGGMATSSIIESALGGATRNIQVGNRIGLSAAAGESDMKRSGFLHRGHGRKKKSNATGNQNEKRNEKGLLHRIPGWLRHAYVYSAMEMAPEARVESRKAIERHEQTKLERMKVLNEKNYDAAIEGAIEGDYYLLMMHSAYCIKGSARAVDDALRRCKSEPEKWELLYEQIKMRVKGCGWKQFHITQTVKGDKRSVAELKAHVKWMIQEEMKLQVPVDPTVNLPQPRNDKALGDLTEEAKEIDAEFEKKSADIVEKARIERAAREEKGIGSVYSLLQPFWTPLMSELVEKRIDVYYPFEDGSEGGTYRWCQGKVTDVLVDNEEAENSKAKGRTRKYPKVMVDWDEIPELTDDQGNLTEDGKAQTSAVELKDHLWRKEKEMA